MEPVRFIHTADVHLGSRLKVGAAGGTVREVVAGATYAALERIVTTTLETGAEFLVVAGDLYDEDSRSVRAAVFVADQFERLNEKGIPVFVVHGNHDPLQTDYTAIRMPENVVVFDAEKPTAHLVCGADGKPRAEVIGVSYRNPRESRKLAAQFEAGTEPVPRIAVLHTAVDPDDRHYAPCSLEDLCAVTGIDYWALGHQHRHEVLRQRDPCVVFPGIPQGRDIGEPGLGGCMCVELEPGTEPRLQFIPTAEVVWARETVELGKTDSHEPAGNVDDVYDRIAARAEAMLNEDTESPPVSRAVRWKLCGAAPVHADLYETEEPVEMLLERLRRDFGSGRPFVWSESIELATAPPIDDLPRLMKDDRVVELLVGLADDLQHPDSPLRARMRDQAGGLWTDPGDPEHDEPTRLPLSESDLDALLTAARDLALQKVLEARQP